MKKDNCSCCGHCVYIALALCLIGALNWGLVGLGYFAGVNINLVNFLLSGMPGVEHAVYLVVGLSAIFVAVTHNLKKK